MASTVVSTKVWEEKLREGAEEKEEDDQVKVEQEGVVKKASNDKLTRGRMYLLTSGRLVAGADEDESQIDSERPMICLVLPCGHCVFYEHQDRVQLDQITLCTVPKVKKYPCGHRIVMKCSEYTLLKEEMKKCPFPCQMKLKCGHPCPMTKCHLDYPNDLIHETGDFQCTFPCEKTLCTRNIHQINCPGTHECHLPCPQPCQVEITHRLSCGHFVTRRCHEKNPQDDGYICNKKCYKERRPSCLHKCPKLCGEDCEPCMGLVSVPLPSCRFKHSGWVKCYQKDNVPHDILCTAQVLPRSCTQTCGHDPLKLNCFEADTITQAEINSRCRQPCSAILSLEDGCGHKCSGSCAECFHYSFHKRCQHNCGKRLICNHYCTYDCGAGCPPCPQVCFRACAHKQCEKSCGAPCIWECEEECIYQCPHGCCTQRCDQICDKEGCMEACPNILPCGHSCVGFCGELCPPYCRYCNTAELNPGALFTGNIVQEDDRFIYLPECGHAVESTAMEDWMNLETDDGEILPKRCPICLTRLGWIHRFSKIMHKNWSLVESVKEHTFGKEQDIESEIEQVRELLEKAMERCKEKENPFYPDILRRVEEMLGLENRSKMYKHKAYFLDWIIAQWRHAAARATKFELYSFHPDLSLFRGKWEELFRFLNLREWPLQKVEMADYYQERKRLDDHTQLYTMLAASFEHNQAAFSNLFGVAPGATMFENIKKRLEIRPLYVKSAQQEFQGILARFQRHMKVTIQLSEEERLQIVEAFGGRTGHFFKCPNGHVYVITECGGPLVRGACPECHSTIGGVRHQIEENNALASEMDGAAESHYDRLIRRQEQLAIQLQNQP